MLAADAMNATEPRMPYHHTVALRIQVRVTDTAAAINVTASGTKVM